MIHRDFWKPFWTEASNESVNQFKQTVHLNWFVQMNQTNSKPKSDGRRDLYESSWWNSACKKGGKNDNHRLKNKKPVDLSLFCGQKELCHSSTAELRMERSGMPQTVWERNGLLKSLPVNLLHPTHTHSPGLTPTPSFPALRFIALIPDCERGDLRGG